VRLTIEGELSSEDVEDFTLPILEEKKLGGSTFK